MFDTTEIPYKLVAKYRNNKIKPLLFPNIIHQVVTSYNHAYTLIEVNDIGGQVADIMQFDLEYDNLLMSSMRGRCLLYTSPSPRDQRGSRMPSSA